MSEPFDTWCEVNNALQRLATRHFNRWRTSRQGKGKSYRKWPSPDWVRDGIAALGRNDEEGAKAALLEGRRDLGDDT